MGCNTSKSAEVDNKNGPKSERPMEEKPLTSEGEDNSTEQSREPEGASSSKEGEEDSGETGETNSSNGHESEAGEEDTLTTKSQEEQESHQTEPPKVIDGGLDEDASESTATTTDQLPESNENTDTGTGTKEPIEAAEGKTDQEPESNSGAPTGDDDSGKEDQSVETSSPLQVAASSSTETTSTTEETVQPVTMKEEDHPSSSSSSSPPSDAKSVEGMQEDEKSKEEDMGDSVSEKGVTEDELEDAKVDKANTSEVTSKEVTNDAQSDGASLAVHPATSETTATIGEWKSEDSQGGSSSPVHEPEVLMVQTPPPSAGSNKQQDHLTSQPEPGDNKQQVNGEDSKEDHEVHSESSNSTWASYFNEKSS